ncbi:hypothetical protein KR009_011279 [Drosophila setifemur]|nr:hypothetical protein KR009_011279 [Drosophila setifemur]
MIYSTSVMSMVKLLELEESLKKHLDLYLHEMQSKFDIIKLFQESLERQKFLTLEEKEEFMGNPLNAFPLLRRLKQDWPKWMKYLKFAIANQETNEMQIKLISGPSHEDFQVALKGITRIEQFYNQHAEDLTQGFLMGTKFNSHLNAPDCVAIGDFHYNKTRFTYSSHWFRTALRLHKSTRGKLYEKVLGLKRKRIYKKYAKSMIRESTQYFLALKGKEKNNSYPELEVMANSAVKKENYENIKKLIDEYVTGDEKMFQEDADKLKSKPSSLERGCRGQWPKKSDPQLVCRYNKDTSAFLKIAPLKMEFLNMQPLIVLYHEVLYKREFNSLRNIAIYNATMADGWTYVNFDKNGNPQREDRVVKIISFQGTTASFTLSINRRIADMTGLEMSENMVLHLTNYGLGGHFGKHVDYVELAKRPPNFFSDFGGDRIATALLYASDVPLGGATVFPKLEIAVTPKKGNALIWFNLNTAGDPDPLTEHSACPVGIGSRWSEFIKTETNKHDTKVYFYISTAISKWIHERQQLFKKPCFTQPSENVSLY